MKGFIYNLAIVFSLGSSLIARAEIGQNGQQGGQGQSPIAQAAFGAAAIIATASAAAAAGIMANSQTQVATIQSQTAVATQLIQRNTALTLAQISASENLFNAQLTRDLFISQKQAEKDNLLTQVRFLASERAADRQLEREKTREQISFQRALLGLKYKELEIKTQVELATVNARLVSAGLNNGLTTVNNGGLTVSSAANNTLVANSPTANYLSSASVGLGLSQYYGQALSSGSTRVNRNLASSDLHHFSQQSLGLVPHNANLGAGDDVVAPSQNVRRHGLR